MQSNNLILTGFMGVGKTTVGRLLARELGLEFIDTDELIERNTGRKIQRIFDENGEAHFRQFETQALISLRDQKGALISTGGGIVTRFENVVLMKELGQVIYLEADADTIYNRIKNGKDQDRPLLKKADPRAEIERLLNERMSLYEGSLDIAVYTPGLTPIEVKNKIIAML